MDNCYTGKVLKDGNLSITNYNEECGTDVVIPEQIDGYTVTEIAEGTWDNNLEKIVGPFGSKNITSVTFPNTITRIGASSFRNNKITNLNIPGNVKYIGISAFNTAHIKKLTLEEGIETIENNVFNSNALTKINIPQSVTYLGGGSFTGNNLTGENAYIYGRNSDGTTDYTTLNSFARSVATGTTIPSNIKTLEKDAYVNLPFKNIVVPGTVKEIGPWCFAGTQAKTVTLEEGIEIIGTSAFALNQLTEITIPSIVKTIGTDAFAESKGYNPIKQITINKKEGEITGAPWGATNAQIIYAK